MSQEYVKNNMDLLLFVMNWEYNFIEIVNMSHVANRVQHCDITKTNCIIFYILILTNR